MTEFRSLLNARPILLRVLPHQSFPPLLPPAHPSRDRPTTPHDRLGGGSNHSPARARAWIAVRVCALKYHKESKVIGALPEPPVSRSRHTSCYVHGRRFIFVRGRDPPALTRLSRPRCAKQPLHWPVARFCTYCTQGLRNIKQNKISHARYRRKLTRAFTPSRRRPAVQEVYIFGALAPGSAGHARRRHSFSRHARKRHGLATV